MLIVMTALLIIANLYFLSSTRQLALSYSEQQNQATWSLFQLTKEFSTLVAITPFSLQSSEHQTKTELSYELTWSRFDLLLNGHEADTFMNSVGAKAFFQHLFERLQKLETATFSLQSPDQVHQLSYQLEDIYQDMLAYINRNFRIKSPMYEQQMAQARQLNQTQIILMVLLFGCVALVTFLLNTEAKYNKQLAMSDALTGIANRLAIEEKVNQYIDNQQAFTLFLLDLNGFKQINDKYGHQAGDAALVELAHRFEQLRSSVKLTPYRIGGDEFAILATDCTHDIIEQSVETLMDCFSGKIEILPNTRVQLSTSLGLATYPHQANNFSELIKIADKNMYQMKFTTRGYTHSN